MTRDISYKNPGAPYTAALLAYASGRPDFYILNAIAEKSWLPDRDDRIPPLPAAFYGQAPAGLPPYMGHSLTGDRLLGESLLDGSQLFSGSFAPLGCGVATLNTLPLVPSRRRRGDSLSGASSFHPPITPDTDPGSLRCQIKPDACDHEGMAMHGKDGKRLPQSLNLSCNDNSTRYRYKEQV